MPRRLSRRGALVGGGAAAVALIGAFAARPADRGGSHDPYFAGLAAALRRAGLMHPTLVVDRRRLEANGARIRASLADAGLPLRVVAKSLPSPRLLQSVLQATGTDRLMVFSAQMLLQLAPLHPRASWLMGKPLPAQEFARVIDSAGADFAGRVQWLIDTPERLASYAAVAQARGLAWQANLEIDVGLHRGGFAEPAALAAVLDRCRQLDVRVAGLMGYDPHVPKMPSPARAFAASQAAYRAILAVLAESALTDPAALTLNGAGSPTFRRHCTGTVANELAVGSAFVKPGDFDLDSLADLQPAAFIATPVLKQIPNHRLPGIEALSPAMHWLDRNARQGFFIHGGHWLARPVSPPGLSYSSLMGRSSNQELLLGSSRVALQPDDLVFLRPDQSEALFLQFGDIAVFDGETIAETWPTLPVSA